MRFLRLIVPIVSTQLWACSDPTAAPQEQDLPVTGDIVAMLEPPVFDFTVSVDDTMTHKAPGYFVRIRDLPPGLHDVRMNVDAGECAVTANPRQVRVVAGSVSEAPFALRCPTGAIVVNVTTTGRNTPLQYTAYTEWVIDLWCEWFSCVQEPVPANGSVTLQDLWTVPHRVMLFYVPDNCQASSVEQSLTVASGAPRHVAFSVVCT